jgi:hypothetical protein
VRRLHERDRVVVGALGKPRVHPRAKVGDRFGTREVTELLAPDFTGNERVRVRCGVCGHEDKAYVFNLRKSAKSERCRRCPKRGHGKGPPRPPESPELRGERLQRRAANLFRAGE